MRNIDLADRWYKCCHCKQELMYGTNPCPNCQNELGWIEKFEVARSENL